MDYDTVLYALYAFCFFMLLAQLSNTEGFMEETDCDCEWAQFGVY